MPPMPPGGIGACGSGSSAINASVVRTKEAIELYLEVKGLPSEKTKFLSLQQIEVEA